MFEVMAMILLALWVVGLVTGNALGGLIHVLLVAGLVSLFVHYRAVSRARSVTYEGSTHHLTRAMEKPAAPAAKSRARRGSRPSAAA